MPKGLREHRQARDLLLAALTSLVVHAATVVTALVMREEAEELVPITVAVDPGRAGEPQAGGSLEEIGGSLEEIEGGDLVAPAVGADLGAGTRQVDVLPPGMRWEPRTRSLRAVEADPAASAAPATGAPARTMATAPAAPGARPAEPNPAAPAGTHAAATSSTPAGAPLTGAPAAAPPGAPTAAAAPALATAPPGPEATLAAVSATTVSLAPTTAGATALTSALPVTALPSGSAAARRATTASPTGAEPFVYKPLFVPSAASREEVDRIWRMRVLNQQLVVTQEALAAFNDREIEVTAPSGPERARGGRESGREAAGAAGASRAGAAGPAGGSPEAGAAGASGSERQLRAHLGGRVTSGSRVSRAPRLGNELRGWCKTAGARDPKAVIRLLVDATGAVGTAFVLRTSGDRPFDDCALGFVRAARFSPGLDAANHPLNVWLHAYVTTSACADRACQAHLRLEQ